MGAAARPAGNPGAWVTSDDYPEGSLRQNQQGETAFRLDVGPEGQVTRCTIVRSSGYRLLDDQSCALLLVRAKFVPATDKKGRAIPSSYASSVRWQIPADSGAANASMISCAFGLTSDIQVVTPVGCIR